MDRFIISEQKRNHIVGIMNQDLGKEVHGGKIKRAGLEWVCLKSMAGEYFVLVEKLLSFPCVQNILHPVSSIPFLVILMEFRVMHLGLDTVS